MSPKEKMEILKEVYEDMLKMLNLKVAGPVERDMIKAKTMKEAVKMTKIILENNHR